MASNTHTRQEIRSFLAEVSRYLDTVELFRAEGCEPTWRPERPRARRARSRAATVGGAALETR